MAISINIDETPLRPNVSPAKPKSKRGPVTFFVDIEAPLGRSVKRNLTRGVNDLDDSYEPPPVSVSLEALLLSLSVSSTFYWDTPVAFDPITADFFLQQFEVGVGGNIDVPDLELSVDIETTAQASISRAPIVVDLTLPQVTTNKTITFEPIDIGLSLPNLESNIETSVDTIVIDLTLPALSTDKETSFDPISLTMSLPDSQVVSDIYGDLAVVDLSVAGTLDVGININLPASMESAQDDDTPSFGSPLLLDTYSGAAAAYSLRKLSNSYAGSCIEVQRGDGQYQTIGFDSNGDLDTASIKTFCDADTGGTPTVGTVRTWYDQSGNGNDATQSTAAYQPKIYDGSAVITAGGIPAVDPMGTSFMPTGANYTQAFSSYVVCENPTTGLGYIHSGLNEQGILAARKQTTQCGIYSGTWLRDNSYTPADRSLFSTLFNGSSSSLHENGSLVVSGNAGTGNPTNMTLFARSATDGLSTNRVSEFIFYESDQSSNRTGIESDINTYYSIYS